MADPVISDVFKVAPTFADAVGAWPLGAGIYQLPDGALVDGERTLEVGTDEWNRVLADLAAINAQNAPPTSPSPAATAAVIPLLAADQVPTLAIDAPSSGDKTKALVVVAIVVAIILYSTRRK